jgi:8-oxo-dGTP pyrophosphatase MutT (NUDIX family)
MNKIIGSGALFYSLSTKRFLFLHRTDGKTANTWGLVGGGTEDGETPFEGLKREIQEEIGHLPEFVKTIPLETFVSNDSKFNFHTYIIIVKEEFIPILNSEHDGYAWVTFRKWPKTLHQGLRNTLQNKTNLAKLETVFQVIDLLET